MAERLARAVLQLSIDDKEYKLALSQIPKDADKAASSVKGIGQAVNLAVFKEFATVAFDAFKTVVGGIVELGERGAAVDDVANSFGILTAKTGETADAMLGKLREGVVGTLSDYDLMTLANKTLGSGLIKTADDMGIVAAGARTLAKATGGTTKEAFDTLTSAMASGRTAQLKQLGLFVDSKVAVEQWAEAHGKSVSAMTDADRAQALAAASLDALRKRMQEIKPDAADFGELIEQGKVKLDNFRDQVAVGIAKSPVFAAGMREMGKALSDAFGADPKAQVAGVVTVIEKVVLFLTYVAQGALMVGTVFATVFSAVEVLVNGVLTAVYGVATGFSFLIEGLARLAAAIPGTGAKMDALAASATATRQNVVEMTKGLAASTAEAAKGVIGQSALHAKLDAMSGVVMRVRDAMGHAEGATGNTTAAMGGLGQAGEDAAGRSEESANKIAEAYRALNDEVVAGTKVGLDRRLYEIEAAKQKELAGLANLKEMTAAEHESMALLITEKYRQRAAAATMAGDEVVAKEREVQQAIALLLTAGTQNKLLQIEMAREKEIAALEYLKTTNAERYAQDVAAVNLKYMLQSGAAQGHYATVEQAAAAAGYKTRAELQLEADNARQLYADMLASGEFTYAQLEAAKKKATDAALVMDKTEALSAEAKYDLMASSASSILRSIFGKSKNAAIAAAIIDTASAVVKTMTAYPFPWSLIPAAAAAAAGYAQIQTIRSQDAGFAAGTPGLDFADFGSMSFQPLHNQEAVIPRGGGHMLAGEIADSMGGSEEQVGLLGRIAGALDDLPREMRRSFRYAMLLDRA